VLCLQGVLKTIIFDQGAHFVAHFWEQLHAPLRTHLIHSSTYNPQTDGQTEQLNKILEDMLGAYMMEHQGSSDKNMPWAEFSYNNNYQESLKMASFEVLYGCRCFKATGKLYLVLTSLMRLKQLFIVFKTTGKLQSHAKRAMQTRGANP
jgi:hypothetical protein